MAAEGPVVPPVQGAVKVGKVVLQRGEVHRKQFAKMPFLDQALQHVVNGVAGGGGGQLADQFRMGQGSGQHVPRFRRVVGHAGLGEHVLAGLQGGQGHGSVHIGPGADAYGVDFVVLQQFPPVPVDPGYVELVGYRPAGLDAAVGHRHNFTVCHALEAGDMAVPHVAASSDKSYADGFFCHVLPPLLMVFALPNKLSHIQGFLNRRDSENAERHRGSLRNSASSASLR